MTKSPLEAAIQAVESAYVRPSVLVAAASSEHPALRVAAASSRSSGPLTLRELAADTDPAVRWAAARNASTPGDALQALADDPLLHPLVLRNPECPPEVLAEVSNSDHYGQRWVVARNPNTPAEVLAVLAKDAERYVRSAVGENPSTTPEVLTALAADDDDHTVALVAANPATPPKVLAQLAADALGGRRLESAAPTLDALARNPSTPPATLAGIADCDRHQVADGIAANPSTPGGVLERLAADWWQREAVARNPSAPAATLATLATDTDRDVRAAVASNLATPPEAFERLGQLTIADPSAQWQISDALAANPSTPQEVLGLIAAHGHWSTRAAVAANPSADAALRERITVDEMRRDAAFGAAFGDLVAVAEAAIAIAEAPAAEPGIERKGRATAPEILCGLADSASESGPNPPLWARLAASLAAVDPKTTPAMLVRLADAGSPATRLGVARNPSTPPEALRTLLGDANREVRWTAELRAERLAPELAVEAGSPAVATADPDLQRAEAFAAAQTQAQGRGMRV